jgi:tripartite-type tricarboxylate transporter receptor subunit TctC
LPFDPVRDLVPVVALGSSPSVLVVSPASGFHTAADLLAAARRKPGRLTYSSVGIGSATHLSAERFLAAAGIEALHVPFKGGAEAMTEVMAGRCDFFFAPVAIALPQIRGGKLVALAVNGSRRSAALPDVPTMAEIGLHNAEYPIWFAIFAPAKTAPAIIDRLNEQTHDVLESRELRDRLAALGVDPMPMTPDELQRFVQAEVAMNATLVRRIGLAAK